MVSISPYKTFLFSFYYIKISFLLILKRFISPSTIVWRDVDYLIRLFF